MPTDYKRVLEERRKQAVMPQAAVVRELGSRKDAKGKGRKEDTRMHSRLD